TFPDLVANGTTSSEYVCVTANHYSQVPVTDVSSSAIRCYELDDGGRHIYCNHRSRLTVRVNVDMHFYGPGLSFHIDNELYHPGVNTVFRCVLDRLRPCCQLGLGDTWFKIWECVPIYTMRARAVLCFRRKSFNFMIPSGAPSGQYLLRGEQIALHTASTYEGGQWYIGCAQLNAVNDGDGDPSPTDSFSTGYEPGISINIYDLPSNYTGYTSREYEY
ncbi:hypothetical protein FISHEDRAFT_50342, partial [Fistulina hepatica ATCC 64428]